MRRHIRFASTIFLTLLLGFHVVGSHAAASLQKRQVSGWYRMMLGQFEITALNDGFFQQKTSLLKNIKPDAIKSELDRQFVSYENGVTTAVNAFLVNTGERLILIDVGTGNCFGPALGKTPDNLRKAGYRPDQVDVVLITHLHPDHVCGLLDDQGKPIYSNAVVYLPKADSDYWLSDEELNRAPEQKKAYFRNARKAVAPYGLARKLKTFSSGEDLFAGISSVETYGHTPGHTSYLLASGSQRMLVWGDIIHNFAVQLPQPKVAIAYDVDSAWAVKTRLKVLPMVVRQRYWVAGAHMPFPGIGHVLKNAGEGYLWLPAQYQPLK